MGKSNKDYIQTSFFEGEDVPLSILNLRERKNKRKKGLGEIEKERRCNKTSEFDISLQISFEELIEKLYEEKRGEDC